uniref:Uncharacterized protein n=1 Tax=Salix viminalis TaxID=40686 RepID=A0A6N2N2B2_SALVM
MSAVGGVNPQDQNISSDSVFMRLNWLFTGNITNQCQNFILYEHIAKLSLTWNWLFFHVLDQDENCGKGVKGKMKPVLMLSTPNSVSKHSQADCSYSMVRTPYADPYFGALCNPYELHAFLDESHCLLILPMTDQFFTMEFSEGDNHEQSLRLKTNCKKPKAVPSRVSHIHAVNRVRGSGGRFLSKKKLQQSDTTPGQCNVTDTIHSHAKNDASELESFQSGTDQSGASNTTCTDITGVSYSNFTLRQPDHLFSVLLLTLVEAWKSTAGLCAEEPNTTLPLFSDNVEEDCVISQAIHPWLSLFYLEQNSSLQFAFFIHHRHVN